MPATETALVAEEYLRSVESSAADKAAPSKVFEYQVGAPYESIPAQDYYSLGTKQQSLSEITADTRFFDIDLSGQGLKLFNMPRSGPQNEKSVIRALNLSGNKLSTVPYS